MVIPNQIENAYILGPSIPVLEVDPIDNLELGLSRWCSGKKIHLPSKRLEFNPWVGKIPWRRKWQPTPVFLPGESNGQRSLADYGP